MRKSILAVALIAVFTVSSGLCVAGPLVRLHVKPGHMSMRPGVSQKYEAYGLDIFGKEVPVTEPLTWSTTAGTITQDGSFTAGKTTGRYMEGVKVTTPSGLKGVAIVTISAPAPMGGFVWERSWGNFCPGQLLFPLHLAVSPRNTLFVGDSQSLCAQEFDLDGRYVGMLGPQYTGSTGRLFAQAVAFAGDYTYIAQSWSVTKFDLTGKVVSELGDPYQFSYLADIATDKDGFLYVLEMIGDERVKKYSPSGLLVKTWGGPGSAEGKFNGPQGICVDSQANVYVAESGNGRVQKFDSNGTFLKVIRDLGPDYDGLASPRDVAVDSSDNLYITDSNGWRVVKLDPSGTVSKVWSTTYEFAPEGIAVDSQGCVYVSSSYEGHVRKYDSEGNLLAKIGQRTEGLFLPSGLAVSGQGFVYASTGVNDLTQKFDLNGNLQGCWNNRAFDQDVDSQGFLYAVEGYSAGKYSPMGELLTNYQIPMEGGRMGLPYCTEIAAGPDGDAYILFYQENKIAHFGTDGRLVNMWSGFSGQGSFSNESRLVTDHLGNVYVLDATNQRIQKFDRMGNYLSTWSNATFARIGDMYVSRDGRRFVTDAVENRVNVFDQSGVLQAWWGGTGSADGKFFGLSGIALDANGSVYVSDVTGNRICKFIKLPSQTATAKALPDGYSVVLGEQIVTASNVDTGGYLYIEAKDRSAGIKVVGKVATRGSKLTVSGTMDTLDGERIIRATSVTAEGTGTIEPIALTNKALGGADLNFDPSTTAGQRGVEDGQGANNIGLLVTTTGKVTATGDGFFYIDDGTHARDGSVFVGVRVLSRILTKPAEGSYVSVTGISRIHKVGDRYFRAIAPRSVADIRGAQ